MRINFKFKYIVMIGVTLGAIELWTQLSKPKEADEPVTGSSDRPVKAYARELSATTSTITAVPVTNWTVQLEAVLTSSSSTTNRAISLLAMYPNLPPEGQLEAVQHSSRLLPNEYFSALGTQLTNAAAAPAVRRAVFTDLLARPNAIKLPWLLEVARSGVDSQSDEALLLLKSQLREDHDTNWSLWRERVNTWLSLHPDPTPPPFPGTPVSN
jgi:hypothetical protein